MPASGLEARDTEGQVVEEGEMWEMLHKVKRTFERSLPVTGHVRLEVRTESGDVTVREGPDDVVRVRGRVWVSGSPGEVQAVLAAVDRQPPIEQLGSAVQIGDLPSLPEWDNCSIGFDWWIEAPGDTEVQVEVDSGDVEVAGLRGPVEVKVDSGDVGLSRIEGDVEVQVDSGDVEGTGLCGRARFDLDSGDLALRDVRGPVRAVVDSGDVALADLGPEIELSVDSGDVSLASAVPDGARWRIETDSGDVEVRLPQDSRCRIEAVGDCGDLDSDLPLVVETDDDGASARGVLGDGATARIEISTDSGDIALRWANG
ncbi:DUF4097 family beta strand repeat protein [Candidatus Bipolaricaulota bacterium]|nr:DUF4097 family beta strand repeat protein [Candidatus Bipolaricaulota bacterium]